MVSERLAWIDDQAPAERLYWFPAMFTDISVTALSSSWYWYACIILVVIFLLLLGGVLTQLVGYITYFEIITYCSRLRVTALFEAVALLLTLLSLMNWL